MLSKLRDLEKRLLAGGGRRVSWCALGVAGDALSSFEVAIVFKKFVIPAVIPEVPSNARESYGSRSSSGLSSPSDHPLGIAWLSGRHVRALDFSTT
jgi:hypothetical protein